MTPHFSAETYADSLMDELFEDVERVLDAGGQIGATLDDPMQEHDAPQSDPSSVDTLSVGSTSESLEPLPKDVDDDDLDALARAAVAAPLTVPQATPDAYVSQPEPLRFVDRLALTAAAASMIAASVCLGLLLYLRSQSTVVATNPNASDAAFIDYMRRSLDVLDRRSATQQPIASGTTPASLPSVNVPGSSGSTQAPAVVERVYVPVYQPPAATTTAPNTLPANPGSIPSFSSTTPSVAAANPHTLVGLLELGDRSAALFEVDGDTQRVQIGESIGNTGWTLVSITNQEAVVRRNGEVRSVYVGQQL
jgi:hypothetical protein